MHNRAVSSILRGSHTSVSRVFLSRFRVGHFALVTRLLAVSECAFRGGWVASAAATLSVLGGRECVLALRPLALRAASGGVLGT